ncbi:MAG: ABC-F type ribosomal protection protein CplR [Clostridium sp.]
MLLIKIKNVKKYYEDRLVLDIEDFELMDGDRIGLVGENGAGKTTLIKAILGLIEVEEGNIFLTESYSYISQTEENVECLEDNKIKKIFNSPKEYKEFLSGGEKVKIRVAKALSENKRLIIGDEPTSNLDSKSIKNLEDMFKNHKGALLLVSHDREFLDNICNKIAEIQDGKIKIYYGNYSKYLELKKEEKNREEREYTEYIAEKNRLEDAIRVKEGLSARIRKTPKRMGNSEARLHRKMGGQKGKKKIDNAIKNIESRIEHLEVKEKPKDIKETKIRIKEGLEIITKTPIEIKNLNLYAGNKLLIKDSSLRIKRGSKTAIIGENGCGKSTLIKEIINNSKEEIKINNKVKIGYFDQEQKILNDNKSILENIKESSSYDEGFIRINLDGFGFKGDSVFKKVSILSGGEKVKVALCKIILGDNNLLILDEPTNYLDIKAVESLEEALKNMDKTLLIVCHDRRFIEKVCDNLIFIENKSIKQFNGTYNEYIKEKEKPNKTLKRKLEEKMIIENKLSEVISLLAVEKNEDIKNQLNEKYNELLKQLKEVNSI